MNPFDALVLDEPPLSFGPDSLVAQGRKAVRRRRAMTVASGVGLAACGVAVAVPLVSPAARDTTVRVGDPTPTAEPTVDGRVPSVIRVISWDAYDHGHTLISLTPHWVRDGQVMLDMLVDDSSTTVGWGIPSQGPPAPSDCGGHFVDCRREVLADGSTLVLHRFVDHDASADVALVFRPDGTEIQINSLDVKQAFPGGDSTPAPSGEPAYSVDQLHDLAIAVNDALNRDG